MTEKCSRCGRPINEQKTITGSPRLAAYCYAVHDYYGCDTGCCGHHAYLCDKDGRILDSHFEFTHPYLGVWSPTNRELEQWAVEFLASLWPGVPVDLSLTEIIDD